MSFSAAVSQLCDAGACHHGEPEFPDFLTWNMSGYGSFRKLVRQIPIPLSDVMDVTRSFDGTVRSLVRHNSVQISVESCYNDDELLSLPYFCILYVIEGKASLRISDRTEMLTAGQLVILPPAVHHGIQVTENDLVVSIISSEEHFAENFSPLLHRDNPVSDFFRKTLFLNSTEPLYFVLPDTREVRSLLMHLFVEFLKKDSFSEILFNNYLQIFFGTIIRQSETAQLQKDHPQHAPSCMPAILNYITQNYRSLDLSTLAGHFHYDTAYLSRLIKTQTGKNYIEIITDLKLNEARELLTSTAMSIEQISYEAGFSGPDYFGYVFKKTYGMTPRAYRKSLHEG